MENSCTPTSSSPRRKRRFVRETPDAFQLTDRDVRLVQLVAEHRFLRSTQLSVLCEAPHKKICDRLGHLFHAGYLDRPRAQFDHYREGGGSATMVYALADRGAKLLSDRSGQNGSNIDWKRKNEVAGRQFIQHTLEIADVRVALARAVRQRPGFQILEPEQLLSSAPPETQRSERPWTWRARVQHNGAAVELGVTPDHTFAVQYPDRRFRVYLVECDRGTMPVDRRDLMQTSLKRKFLTYAAAHREGLPLSRWGWKAFRVLLICPNAERSGNALASIRLLLPEQLHSLLLFADRTALLAADILSYP